MRKWALRIALVLLALLVAAFAILRTPDTDAAAMRAKYGAENSMFLNIDRNVTIHVRDDGPRDGRVIVLLHGSNADLQTWQPWTEGLEDDYRVVRFDQRGHGLTGSARDGDYSSDRFVEDIDAVTRALGVDTFVLGGNSMGGGHAVAFALAHPERLDGLILVDAGGAPVRGESKGNIGFTIARTPGLNRVMEHITPRSMIEKSLRQSVSNQSIVTPQAVDRYWELLRYPGNRAATVARFSRGWTTFPAGQVEGIETPTLILWGEEDNLIPVEAGRWYASHLPNARIVTYPDIGHLSHEEAAAATLGDVREWLANAPPR